MREEKRSEKKRSSATVTPEKGTTELFILLNRERTAPTVSHLSPKPLDPQGERLSEGRRVAPSRAFGKACSLQLRHCWQ